MNREQAAAELDAIEALEREPWLSRLNDPATDSPIRTAAKVVMAAAAMTVYFWAQNRFGILLTFLALCGLVVVCTLAIQPWMRRRDLKVMLPLSPPRDIRKNVSQYQLRHSAPIGLGVAVWIPFALAVAEHSNLVVLAAVNLIGCSAMVALMAWWTNKLRARLASGWEPGPLTAGEILVALIALIAVCVVGGVATATFVHFLQ